MVGGSEPLATRHGEGDRPFDGGGILDCEDGLTEVAQQWGPASTATAKAVAVDQAKVLEALKLREGRVYAPTTVGPRASKRKLIEFLITNAAQGGPYPLTPFRIRFGAVCLLAARYRTVSSYLCEAEKERLRRGHA